MLKIARAEKTFAYVTYPADKTNSPWLGFCIVGSETRASGDREGVALSSPDSGTRVMRMLNRPTTYLTADELRHLADAKFDQAASLPDGEQRAKILKSAYGFRNLAEMKGWLSSDLRPPK